MLWRLIRPRLAPHLSAIVVIVVLQLVSTIASLYLPNLNGDIIDQGIARGDTGYILRTGGWMLAISVLQIAASVYAVYLAARTAMAFGRDTRAEVFHGVVDFSAREVAQFGAPTLISRTTNDVQQTQMVVFMALSMMVGAPIMMVGGVIMALRTDVGLSWLVAGDVLVSVRAPVGPTNLAPVDCAIGRGLASLRARGAVDQRYLLWAMRASEPELAKHGAGSTFAAVTGSQLRAHPIAVAPIKEQRRIVEIIEDHLSRLDAANRELAKASARLERLDEAALARVLPSEGPSRPVVDLLEAPLSNGRSVPTREGGFPVLRLTALKDAGVDLAERKEGALTRKDAARFLVQRGDFLIARGNGSLRLVGRGSLVRDEPDDIAFPDTIVRARPQTDLLLPDFLDVVWNARRTRDQIEAVSRTSAGIYKISQSQLNAIKLPSLPIEEQQEVVSTMRQIDDQRARSVQAFATARNRGDALRRAVLAAAFEGKLTGRHTDAEVIEERASV